MTDRARGATLPSWAEEIENTNTKCIHCEDVLTVATALGFWLGGNGSYFCDATNKQLHEPRGN